MFQGVAGGALKVDVGGSLFCGTCWTVDAVVNDDRYKEQAYVDMDELM